MVPPTAPPTVSTIVPTSPVSTPPSSGSGMNLTFLIIVAVTATIVGLLLIVFSLVFIVNCAWIHFKNKKLWSYTRTFEPSADKKRGSSELDYFEIKSSNEVMSPHELTSTQNTPGSILNGDYELTSSEPNEYI